MSRCHSIVLIIICVSLLIPMVSGLGVDIGPDQSVRFGDTVPFRVSVSDLPAGTVLYTWNFGDGTTISGSSTNLEFLTIHRYTHEGIYIAHLSVKGEDGTGAVDTAIITVATVEGRVVGWGLNDYGQAMPPPGSDYIAIGGGYRHSLALKSEGSLVGWGLDDYGQATPPPGNNYVAIAAGYWHNLALKSDGSLMGWGRYYQATPPGNNYVAIGAGWDGSLALKSDGSIVGWGHNSDGWATPPSGKEYIAIAAGGYHGLALKSDGSIVGWGNNSYGQATPPSGNDYVAIAAGGWHSIALKSDGTIVGWGGDNRWGQATPPPGHNYVAIAAGYWHNLALKSDGSIVGWGYNNYGQAMPPPGNNYVGIGAGTHHSFALTPNHHPVANAGSDLTVNVYSAVNLDGSLSSDPDNDPLTYKWSILTRPAGSTAILSDTTAQKPDFTADKIGDYTIQLIVNDGQVDSAPSTVTLHATQYAVPVDIEPGICPNIIALNWKGPYLFVVIPGTNNLESKKIDPATITLSRQGSNGVVKPRVNTIFDIATPYTGTTTCGCHNKLFDYTQDLVLAFDLGEVMTNLQLQDVVGETVPFTVNGMLKAEYGTTPVTGSDCMNVLSEYGNFPLLFLARCPVDLKITDPDGLVISKISHEIPTAFYIEADFNDDGSPDDFIFICEMKIGDYSIQVIPELNALPTDTYSLTVGSGQSEVILANNVAISNVPDNPYKIHVAQNGEIATPPDLINPGDKSIFEGKTLTFDLVASDPDGDSLTYSFSSSTPLAGATLTGNTFTWTPGSGCAGLYLVTFKVTHSGGLSDEETIKITVTIPTNVKIVPKTINQGSKGYFLAFVTLPNDYKDATIDMKTVSCSGAPAIRMMRLKIFPRIVGFVFRTSDLKGIGLGTKISLTVQGQLKKKGITYIFSGSDKVTVINKPGWQPDDIKDVSKITDDQLFKKYST